MQDKKKMGEEVTHLEQTTRGGRGPMRKLENL
jgi:hypothetical protein